MQRGSRLSNAQHQHTSCGIHPSFAGYILLASVIANINSLLYGCDCYTIYKKSGHKLNCQYICQLSLSYSIAERGNHSRQIVVNTLEWVNLQ